MRGLIGRGWARYGDVLRVLRGLDRSELSAVEAGPYLLEPQPMASLEVRGDDDRTEDVAELFGGRPTSMTSAGARGSSPLLGLATMRPDARIIFLGGQGQAVLGRVTGCDVTVPDDSISRRHARIEGAGERWSIVDLGSSNGTKVGGKLLTPNVPVPLGEEQTVQLGSWTCLVVLARRLVAVARAQPV